MTLKSNKYLRSLPVAMLALAVCSSVHADNGDSIDITFRANIRDTTCDMTINELHHHQRRRRQSVAGRYH